STRIIPKSWHLKLFYRSDELLKTYPICTDMSRISRRLVQSHDYDKFINKRRENYQYLLQNWNFPAAIPMYQHLPDFVCPHGFIVLAKDRDYLRSQLAKANIYCPVHWEPTQGRGHSIAQEIKPDEFALSWEIAKRNLMIPIDHRYGIKEMRYIITKMHQIYP
ncbi:MAG: DegT/DnrJ/EryC1/StrS family aminotransferase, partial [Eubacteriales bacterium]